MLTSIVTHRETSSGAGPLRTTEHTPLGRALRGVRDNGVSVYSGPDFDADFIEQRWLWRRRFIINEPSAVRHVLADNAANYRKSELARRLLEPGIGRGLVTSEGEMWRRHRRIMAPSFDPRSVAGYAPIMTAVAATLLVRWDGLADGSEADIAAEMMRTTLHVISRAMFTTDSDGIMDVVERGVARYQATMRPTLIDLLLLPAWLNRLFAPRPDLSATVQFRQEVDRLIRARSAAADRGPDDLLGRLTAARDEETGAGLTTTEIRDEVATIFMAGHETTAQALSWAWFLLSCNPTAEARLHGELARVLAGRVPTHEDVARLPYARMVVEETMRLYPPAYILARDAIGPDEISGHPIPPGSTVLILPWLLHRKPSLWERPERFEPERFSAERVPARRYAYIPFGAGPRICIGAAFAMEEAILILATIAQRYRLRLAPGQEVEPQGLITLRPRHGLRMRLERR